MPVRGPVPSWMDSAMRRGDIVWARLDPAEGSEANKVRPVVIVGRDAHTQVSVRRGRGVVTVVPVTSNVTRVLPFQALLEAELTGLDRDSKAQAEQVRSLDVARLGGVIGRVPAAGMADIERALRVHLAL